MKQYNVGVIGATGMVGQRFITLLENHPWFNLVALAASTRSAGKTYEEAVGSRWLMKTPMPESVKKMVVLDAANVEEVAAKVDFVFCAVNMKKDEIKALEEAYAKAECPVVSNNSAHRFTPDVPMVVPEINADHIDIIPAQRKRLGTKRGFVAVKSNCSLQSYVPALHPLRKYGISDVLVCTYQAISGAGKTFETFPDILDNVIPYIGGEEEKSEQEPLKLWGHIEGDKIVSAESPRFTAQCLRVPVSDGHMGAVFVRFENKPSKEEILQAWKEFHGPAQDLELPSAPKQFLHYFEENDRPQPKLDRMLENGMAVSIGRLREDNQYDYKFVCLSHNTLRGAAGGAVLLAELLAAKGYFDGVAAHGSLGVRRIRMKRPVFTGAAVAIITPMNTDGNVNYDELGRIIDDQIAHSTDAIVICGTTGESPTLTDEEHTECIRYTVKKAAGRVPVIAGTGSNDTKYAIWLSQQAEADGADALLLVTPYYNKTSQAGLLAHYTAIADAVHIPCILYNVPSRTGCNLTPATLAELAKHPNINAVKEASGNISHVAEIAAACGDSLNIYSGNDDQIVPLLALGGKGVISVLSNVAPQYTHDICAKWFAGETAESLSMQLKAVPLIKALFADVNPIPVKWAMNRLGWNAGDCRLPLVAPSAAVQAQLETAMQEFGLLK